jgi:hypothetical protein
VCCKLDFRAFRIEVVAQTTTITVQKESWGSDSLLLVAEGFVTIASTPKQNEISNWGCPNHLEVEDMRQNTNTVE